MGIFPNFRGENKQYLKPPPSGAVEFESDCKKYMLYDFLDLKSEGRHTTN